MNGLGDSAGAVGEGDGGRLEWKSVIFLIKRGDARKILVGPSPDRV